MSENLTQLEAARRGIVTSEMLKHVRRVVPLPNSYSYRVAEFTSKGFPFEAYVLPEMPPAITGQ